MCTETSQQQQQEKLIKYIIICLNQLVQFPD